MGLKVYTAADNSAEYIQFMLYSLCTVQNDYSSASNPLIIEQETASIYFLPVSEAESHDWVAICYTPVANAIYNTDLYTISSTNYAVDFAVTKANNMMPGDTDRI